VIVGVCCAGCASGGGCRSGSMGRARGLGWGWDDLNPVTLAKDVGNNVVDAVGSVAGNVASTVDRVTKTTLGTALAAGATVRQLSSPSTQPVDVPTTSYLPIAVGGGAALFLLLLATKKKKPAATP
jgi:hypothetical protein